MIPAALVLLISPPIMLKATITTGGGQTVILEGDATEIGQALLSLGSSSPAVKRGPGRPPKALSLATNGHSAPAPKARKPVSPEVARARVLQGQYLGALRGLSATDKKKVQAITKEKGVAAGLAQAKAIGKTKKK